ncbi:TetR/AcrR family transcriptional regulator [Candidatus Frankia alpina]|uniref:TetR/AcrR family transcriptional regulator n=1 Tax=Candidatus Frankia alpina TaxID=2699483 RepID=A0A4V3YY42_9ACTN|nr:TetR/AcrR family transcriptional regulator [Candidatus Frankia alpina]THJ37622.1 TetR/AcrR family transcriptional regulator [Candidatus Frankia alpina]
MVSRPHTGRRRNEAARRAVLAATISLLRRSEMKDVTIEAIAREARVGRQTIYRWWPSRAVIVLEAAEDYAEATVPDPGGAATDDLRTFLRATYVGAASDRTAPILRAIAAEALVDTQFADVLHRFTAARRAVLRSILQRHGASPELSEYLSDVTYGLLWYRLLVGHAALDETLADTTAALVVEAIEADREPRLARMPEPGLP